MATTFSDVVVGADQATRLAPVRRAALGALIANLLIVVTGGIVRITGSGLGCPDWPACEGTSVIPPAETAQWHSFVEFGNRLLTFLVLGMAAWVMVATWRVARDRADLRRLALFQVGGVLFQAVLGGVTVWMDLHPLIVAAHFLASMVLIAAAVALHDRARAVPADAVAGLRLLTGALVFAAGAVLVLGTIVTGAGPHAGDPGTIRLPLDVRTFAVAHADAVWLLVGLTIAVLVVARAQRAARTTRATLVLLGLVVAQGGLGYLQYALGVPPVPVIVHVLGAALVWAAAWRVAMAVRPAGS